MRSGGGRWGLWGEGQCRQRGRVFRFDVQNADVVYGNLSVDERFVWLRQFVLVESDLDGDFPLARGTELDVVRRVFDD